MKELTQEQFDEMIYEVIPQQLFHVMPTDIDSETGVRCDELILVQMLNEHPELLRFERLSWFVDHFITSMDKSMNKENFLALVSEDDKNTMLDVKDRIDNRDKIREYQRIALLVNERLDELGWPFSTPAGYQHLSIISIIPYEQIEKITSGKTETDIETLKTLEKVLKIKIII